MNTECREKVSPQRTIIRGVFLSLTAICLLSAGCSRPPARTESAAPEPPSQIKVEVKPGGPIVLTTSAAEFQILPLGYIQAALLKGDQRLTLDQVGAGGSDVLVLDGKPVQFTLDLGASKVEDSVGKLGRGKRLEIPAQASSGSSIQRTLQVEVYDAFPTLLLSSAAYKNAGTEDIHIDSVVEQQHKFDAGLAQKNAKPYDMWSYLGASYDWGKDDVGETGPHFRTTQPDGRGGERRLWRRDSGGGVLDRHGWRGRGPCGNPAADAVTAGQSGGGWWRQRGRGHCCDTTLKPGETYSTPRSFVAVYSGDFYEPLHLWSSVLQKEGWEIPKPSSEAYNVSWCGWGYEFNVTPAEMLGTVPKLKEFGIKWATLDDRWFDTYGDWNPRADTFPGDSIKKMTDDFHKQGMLVQLWWLPLGVEDGQGRWESHKYIVSKIAQEHPEWLILDKNGKHARMTRDLAALCPAVPEVQAYFKKLTEKFIGEWGFDGSKLDNIYSVPMCYNPAHHHKSPQDSVNAMADVYKTIFQTSRALKPESVTQSCPCGTPPSLAWLPFIDQAVTADPVGAVQVRRRIKMYKALLGPESAVYGDHVELSDHGSHRQQLARARRGLRLDHRRGRRGGNKVRMARSRTEIQGRGPDSGERRTLEEVDRHLQPEDAFEGNVPQSLRLRVRHAGRLRDRERWKDVLRVFCSFVRTVERRDRTARTYPRELSRTRLR